MLDDDREDLFAGNCSFLLMCLHKLFCSWTERNVLFWKRELKTFYAVNGHILGCKEIRSSNPAMETSILILHNLVL